MSLDEVVARLAQRDDIVGVVLLGTTATGDVGRASDYDLLVVTTEGPEFDVEFTYVDHRPTDVLFVALPMIRRLVDESVVSRRDGDIARWLAAGKVVLARTSELRTACEALGRLSHVSGGDGQALFARWVEANFNLIVNRRYLAEGNRTYQRALDMRLLYGLFEAVMDYLRFRGIPWQGEKEAVRWFDEHDPAFIALFETALTAATREERTALYEQLVERACEPVGGLWGAEETAGGWSLGGDDPRRESRWERLFT